MTAPDTATAVQKYKRLAATYDRLAPLTRGLRERAVRRLELSGGETVLDVGCGTGLTFAALVRGVGRSGRVIGIEVSPEMLAVARRRVLDNGWANVSLIEAPAETAEPGVNADAAIFVLVHDITQSAAAIENVASHLKTGARVVATGAKRARRWALPVNVFLRSAEGRYITTNEGLERPWLRLEERLGALEVEPHLLGGAYLAAGRVDRVGR